PASSVASYTFFSFGNPWTWTFICKMNPSSGLISLTNAGGNCKETPPNLASGCSFDATLISWTHLGEVITIKFRRMCPMKHKKNSKRYNDGFRKMVVELYHSGQSVRDLSSEYGVSEVTIYKWIKDFTPVDESDEESLTSKEVAEIQKENLKLKQELEILKKAMAIFAKKNKCYCSN